MDSIVETTAASSYHRARWTIRHDDVTVEVLASKSDHQRASVATARAERNVATLVENDGDCLGGKGCGVTPNITLIPGSATIPTLSAIAG
jgi:hypothetical protein